MKYFVKMGSGAMMHIPSFIKIASGIQKLIGGDAETHRQHGDRISQFYESRLKQIIRKLCMLQNLCCHFCY
jgi:hypothetical protein